MVNDFSKIEEFLGSGVVKMAAKAQLLDAFISMNGPVSTWKKEVSRVFDQLYNELNKEA